MAFIVVPATAAILGAVILEQLLWPASGTAFDLADLPNFLTKAKTIHMNGQFFVPVPGRESSEVRPLEFDYWFDSEKGRYRLHKPAGLDTQTGDPVYYTTVSDGEYVMEEMHSHGDFGEKQKSVQYTRLSPYQMNLGIYRNSYRMLMRLFGGSKRLEEAKMTGNEVISGRSFEIWRNEWFEPDGRGSAFQIWLSRETGLIGKITLQTKSDRNTPEWIPYMSINSFEVNSVPPMGTFLTEPPDGFGLINTKEDAPESELGVGRAVYGCRDYGLFVHIGFTLPDRSVLIAWSCRNEGVSSGAKPLKDVEAGGPLPELPAVIAHLEPIPRSDGLSYTGYHLIFTEKNGIVYEWTLYIPNRTPPPRDGFTSYRTNIEYSIDKSRFKTFPNRISDDIPISTKDEFEKWVRGALNELSDPGGAPREITYESLLKLAAKLK